MKKIIKIMCVFIILALCSVGASAADIDNTKEEAAKHAAYCRQQMEIRENILKKEHTDNRVSLMSYYQVPSVLKKLANNVTIYNSDEIYEEIYFAQTSDAYWFEAALYSVKDKCFIDNTYISIDGLYDDYGRYEGVYIDYIDAWELEPGEYYIYIIDENNNYYEPVSFIINPFEIYDAEFSTTASYNYLYMNMEKTDIHYNGRILESVTFEGFDENNNRAFLLSNIPISYADTYGIDVNLSFPSHLSGRYDMSVILNFYDGTKENLGKTQINLGDYLVVDSFYTENNYITPNTKNIQVFVDLSEPMEKDENITLIMYGTDSNNILYETSDYKIAAPESHDGLTLMFDIPVNSPINEDVLFELDNGGYRDILATHVYMEYSDVLIKNLKHIGNDVYTMKIEGIKPGVYDAKYNGDYDGDTIGTLEVDKDGNGVFTTAGYYIEYETLCFENTTDTYTVNMGYISYDEQFNKLPHIDSIFPKYIMNNSTVVNNMTAYFNAERAYSADEISVKLYDYDGKEVATATDIKVSNSYFNFYEGSKVINKIKFSFKNLPGNFNANYSYNVVINAGGECAVEEIYIADNTYTGAITDIYAVGCGNKFGGLVVDEYNNIGYCYSVSKGKARFAIDWMCKPLEYAELYKYNPNTYQFELYSTKTASQLVSSTSIYGNGYGCNIEFDVSHEGIYKMITEGSESELVYVTFKNFVYNEYEFLNVYDDYAYLYLESSGLRIGSETFGAYYLNSYGQRINIPVTYEYEEDNVDFEFNFSNIRNFGYMCVYITCNGVDAGSVMAYDKRNDGYYTEVYGEIEDASTYIGIYGDGINNITNPVLNICTEEIINGTPVLSAPVIKKALNLSQGYAEIMENELNLLPGKYYAYLTSGDDMLSIVSAFMIMDKTEVDNMPVKIMYVSAESDCLHFKLVNTDNKDYDNGVIVAAAYDNEGKLVSANIADAQIKAGSMLSTYIDITSAADEHKIFVFENKTSLKPLAKLY